MKRNVAAHALSLYASPAYIAGRLRTPWTTLQVAAAFLVVVSLTTVAVEAWLVPLMPAVHDAREKFATELLNTRRAEEARQLFSEIDEHLAACSQTRDQLWTILRNDLQLLGTGPDYAGFKTPDTLDALVANDSSLADSWSRIETALRGLDELAALQDRTDGLRTREPNASTLSALHGLAQAANSLAAKCQAALEAANDLSVAFRTQELRRSVNERKEP